MNVKTSVTLSENLLATIDELVGHWSEEYRNRSAFLEKAAWEFIAQLRRDEQTAKDIEIINRRADYLNQETANALTYQGQCTALIDKTESLCYYSGAG